jgi:hypothetical protein
VSLSLYSDNRTQNGGKLNDIAGKRNDNKREYEDLNKERISFNKLSIMMKMIIKV